MSVNGNIDQFKEQTTESNAGNAVEEVPMDTGMQNEPGISHFHEELWALRASDVARAYHEVIEVSRHHQSIYMICSKLLILFCNAYRSFGPR